MMIEIVLAIFLSCILILVAALALFIVEQSSIEYIPTECCRCKVLDGEYEDMEQEVDDMRAELDELRLENRKLRGMTSEQERGCD